MDASHLRQILADPAADAPRLVYADWLEEQGRRGQAAFLRAEVATTREGGQANAEAFHRSRGGLSAEWLHPFEQPGVIRSTGLPWARAWWSIGLGEARPARGTYQRYDYDTLPPVLPDLATGWSWLEGGPSRPPGYAPAPEALSSVQMAASEAGYTLPDTFTTLFERYLERRTVIRSCTDCTFELNPQLWRPAEVQGGLLVPFYNDSQSVISWGLWLHPSGSEAVVAFGIALPGDELPEEVADSAVQIHADGVRAVDLVWVSPSFTSFVYRFALENDIWFSVHGMGEELTLEQRAYLDHYRQP